MSESQTVSVKDYSGDRIYRFDRSMGAASPLSDEAAIFGFGQWRTIGLLRDRRRLFVTVFLDGDSIRLSVDRSEYPLLRAETGVHMERCALGLGRRVRLTHQGEDRCTVAYWFLGDRGWPDDGDIFSLAKRITEAKDGGQGFVRIWKAKSEGRDLASKEFLNELQRTL